MLQDRMKLFGIVAVTAVATAGWMRQPQAVVTPVNSFVAPAGSMLDPAYAIDQPFAVPVSATAVPVHSGVYRQTGAPVARAYARAVQRADRIREIGYRPETVVQERSKAKSAAIIGGGAAAGAAIGGLAGGGKGAAIGALSGGAAGLVYDRMTHKKGVPAEDIGGTTYSGSDDHREGRSTAKSAVIIGGGAAAGAAVGAAAGGGKGAAIGALGGGAAGLIYDRMTKNR